MNKIKSLVIMVSLAMTLLFTYSPAKAVGKGTLMGNAAGTKFCCAAGTNDCSAAACGPANEL